MIVNKHFENLLFKAYESIRKFTITFLDKQELMNQQLKRRFQNQLQIEPPFELKNEYL